LIEQGRSSGIDWAVAGVPIDGEVESGDLHVVAEFEGGVLIGAIDGLGHGPQAAQAARAALAILGAHAGQSARRLLELCHEGLRRTRGAVITLASFQTGGATLTWLGVGNVEGALLRGDRSAPIEAAPLRGGIIGFRLPRTREATIALFPNDTLILATDGINGGFSRGLDTTLSPSQLAEAILAQHRKRSDDATVVVARYLGEGS
jgi:serine phosphatase RsbU (regulator of sigma subunit)